MFTKKRIIALLSSMRIAINSKNFDEVVKALKNIVGYFGLSEELDSVVGVIKAASNQDWNSLFVHLSDFFAHLATHLTTPALPISVNPETQLTYENVLVDKLVTLDSDVYTSTTELQGIDPGTWYIIVQAVIALAKWVKDRRNN